MQSQLQYAVHSETLKINQLILIPSNIGVEKPPNSKNSSSGKDVRNILKVDVVICGTK
jgi:hypothetical protein